ncbi:MAG: Cof-type HAD-IIB family hydrolase [Lachnospiraceae bacterium]|nr:Cof-type HAD-IIB family hydrolase [Lachnospiraceae bacterium]
MERKSIISFDLDMTLLDHATYQITESAMEAVERLRKHHRIVVASGRDMDNYFSFQFRDQLKPDGIIHMNGTKVTVGEESIYNHFMQKELLTELLQFAKAHELSLGATIDGKDYYTCPDTVRAHDRKKWGDVGRRFGDADALLDMPVRTLAYIGGEDGVKLLEEAFPQMKFPMFAGKVGADAVEKEASKAEGLKRLCEYWGIDIRNTAAFGDSMNDMEILQEAGIGIAMGNGIPELKDAADYVTADIREDGVRKACEHFSWFEKFYMASSDVR